MPNQTTSSGTIIEIEVPVFLLEVTKKPTSYVTFKQVMLEMYITHINSDSYKESDKSDMSSMVFQNFNELIDNLFLKQL